MAQHKNFHDSDRPLARVRPRPTTPAMRVFAIAARGHRRLIVWPTGVAEFAPESITFPVRFPRTVTMLTPRVVGAGTSSLPLLGQAEPGCPVRVRPSPLTVISSKSIFWATPGVKKRNWNVSGDVRFWNCAAERSIDTGVNSWPLAWEWRRRPSGSSQSRRGSSGYRKCAAPPLRPVRR